MTSIQGNQERSSPAAPAAELPVGGAAVKPEREPSVGERLAAALLRQPPSWRARVSRAQSSARALELEELLESSGCGWLRAAPRDRALQVLQLMAGQQRGQAPAGGRLPLGAALRRRDHGSGNQSGRSRLERICRADAATLPRELARATQLVGPWSVDWGLPIDLAIRWDDPVQRSRLLRRLQLDYLHSSAGDVAGDAADGAVDVSKARVGSGDARMSEGG